MIFNMSGGGKKIQGTATPAKVLDGETFMSAESKDVQEGAMPNIGAVAVALNAGESYTPAEGYHNGLGAVTANSLESQTAANAAAAQILAGYNAWVNGRLVTGSMANNGAVSQALNAGGSYTIPAGYHNGSGKVTANTLASQTAGTAAAADIAKGKTAWVGGNQLTGTKVPEGTATPDVVKEGYTFQSAASEGLQTGTHTAASAIKTYSTTKTVVTTAKSYTMAGRIVAACTLWGSDWWTTLFSGTGAVLHYTPNNNVNSLSSDGRTLRVNMPYSDYAGANNQVFIVYIAE